MGPAWTATKPLPGGDLGDVEDFARDLVSHHPALPAVWLREMARRYGSRANQVIGDARQPADLGLHFGAVLYAREIDYLVRSEWARTAEDVLWRRTKAGLRLAPERRQAVGDYIRALSDNRLEATRVR